MRWTVLVVLVSVALAGCVGGFGSSPPADDSDEQDTSNDTTETEDLAFDQDVPENATDGDAHRHPQWDGQTEKVLFEGTVTAGNCQDAFTAFYILSNVAFRQEAAYGCADWRLQDGSLVPQGTENVTIEIDATDARQRGEYDLSMWTGERYLQKPPTDDDEHTFVFDLRSQDWDDPHQDYSRAYWIAQARAEGTGEAAVLEGDVEVKVVAHKIPGWVPPLAAAHVDHWKLEDRHEFITPDIIEVANKTVAYQDCGWVNVLAPDPADVVEDCQWQGGETNLSDIVPPGTAQVAVAMTWTEVQDCPPQHDCTPEHYIESGENNYHFGEPVQEGDRYKVFVYDVPKEVAADSTYANESLVFLHTSIDGCLRAEAAGNPLLTSCFQDEPAFGPKTDVHYAVEAWREPVDVDAFTARRLPDQA